MRYDDPTLREMLAGEYVIGTMPRRTKARFERLMREDAALAREVAAWAERFAPLDEATPVEEPPARVWRAIEKRIPPPAAPPQHTWREWLASLALWRGLALGASAVAAALIIYVAAFTGPAPVTAPHVVAVLTDKSGAPAWIATAGPRPGEIAVAAIRPQPLAPNHSFELWSIAGGAPKPLGLLPPQPGHPLVLAAGAAPAGGVLAVSLEPPGGSPTGSPTGPVLYQGHVL